MHIHAEFLFLLDVFVKFCSAVFFVFSSHQHQVSKESLSGQQKGKGHHDLSILSVHLLFIDTDSWHRDLSSFACSPLLFFAGFYVFSMALLFLLLLPLSFFLLDIVFCNNNRDQETECSFLSSLVSFSPLPANDG